MSIKSIHVCIWDIIISITINHIYFLSTTVKLNVLNARVIIMYYLICVVPNII